MYQKKLKIIEDVKDGLQKYAKGYTESKFNDLQELKNKNKELLMLDYLQKSIALHLEKKRINTKSKVNQVCEDFYLYANSRSSLSSPYYKLE